MRIDAHQHYWHYNNDDYPWIKDSQGILKQDYLPGHLEPAFVENGFHGGIAVQARQTQAETDYLLALKADSRFVLGVVGWVDLCADDIDQALAAYSGKACGFRHQLEDEPTDYMLSPAFRRGIGKLDAHGFSYDLLVKPHQLEAAIQLVDEFPNQRFVLDHLAKPDYSVAGYESWSHQFRALAERPHVYCKLSGMVTELPPDFDDELLDIDPYLPFLDCALEAFTPARLMYGSDWPVATLAATYDEVYDIISVFTEKLTIAERDQIMGQTAKHFYQLTQE